MVSAFQGRRAVPDAKTVSGPHFTNHRIPELGPPVAPRSPGTSAGPGMTSTFVRARSSGLAPLPRPALFAAVVLMLLVPSVTYGEGEDVLEAAPPGSLPSLSPGTANPERSSPGKPGAEGALGFVRDLLDGSRSEERFLLPDEAFRLLVGSEGPGRLLAAWQSAPEHCLYRERFEFELGEGASW